MKRFCIYIYRRSTEKIFDINISVFISKKKRHMHFVFYNVFLSFENYDDMTNFSQKMDQTKKHFSDYTMNYPKMISSTKWKYDYVVFRKKI